MTHVLIVLTMLTAAGIAPATAAAGEAQAEEQAYAACTRVLSQELARKGYPDAEFAPLGKVLARDGVEVTLSFPAGSIPNIRYTAPHPLTLADKPAASCTARIEERRITRVLLDGDIVRRGEMTF